jgi:hypothetical protein
VNLPKDYYNDQVKEDKIGKAEKCIKDLVRKLERKRQLGKSRHRWEETGWEGLK